MSVASTISITSVLSIRNCSSLSPLNMLRSSCEDRKKWDEKEGEGKMNKLLLIFTRAILL